MKCRSKKTIQTINKTKSCFFEKISKIDKPLANMTKMRREKTQISKIRTEKGEKTTQRKPKDSSETTLITYILINLKILKKWTNF
jgi:hypothetical protein